MVNIETLEHRSFSRPHSSPGDHYSDKNYRRNSKMKILESVAKILLVVLALLLVSCEEKIDLSVAQSGIKKLVVDGMLTSDTTNHVVTLSYTGDFYMDSETPRASGARVSIWDDHGNTFLLHEDSPGRYITEDTVYGKVGRTYTLHIEYEGETYESSSTMQRVPQIDSLSYRWDNYIGYYRIRLYGKEPEGKGDKYMWHIYKNSQKVTDNISKVQIADDTFIDGNYIEGFEVDWWDNEFDFQKGDTITVAKHSLTDEAYDFLRGVFTEHNNGQMAMRPPANIASNISNGGLGLFFASAVSYKTMVIE